MSERLAGKALGAHFVREKRSIFGPKVEVLTAASLNSGEFCALLTEIAGNHIPP